MTVNNGQHQMDLLYLQATDLIFILQKYQLIILII